MPLSAKNIISLDVVDSTNNYAMGLIQKAEARHGTAIFARDQTSGKGRHQRVFDSEPGKNIILSVITAMNGISISNRFVFSMLAALSVTRLIDEYYNLKSFVKWPNDIIINDKKAVGILIENVFRGTIWQWAVTGFGVNVNQQQFPGDYAATSLFNESGQAGDVSELTLRLATIFLEKFEELKSGNEKNIVAQYNKRLFKRGEKVKLQSGNRIFEATVKGVSKDGRLITQDVFEKEWDLDEVRMKL